MDAGGRCFPGGEGEIELRFSASNVSFVSGEARGGRAALYVRAYVFAGGAS